MKLIAITVALSLALVAGEGAQAGWLLSAAGTAEGATASLAKATPVANLRKLLDGRSLKPGTVRETALAKSVRAKLDTQAADGKSGPQGLPGKPGLAGLPGAPSTVPGPRGATGAASTVPGPQGIPGPPGNDGTVAIPTMDAVAHCNPTDQNSQEGLIFHLANQTGFLCSGAPGLAGPAPTQGQINNALTVFCTDPVTPNFNHCVGPPGPKGDTGLKGDTGTPGADSTVPGPQGPKGDTGSTGPQGSPGTDCTGQAPLSPPRTCSAGGLPSMQWVSQTTTLASGNSTQTVTADCPAGKAPISGGFTTGAGNVVLTSAHTDTGWKVILTGTNGNLLRADDVTVEVLCA